MLPYWLAAGNRRLVEPFAGGLAVTLGLMPKRALLNDINPHVINFYKWLKQGLVVEQKFDHNEAAFYKARNRFNALLKKGKADTAEAAALFYYLNRTGYNGLCRFNRSGAFNVPFGQHRSLTYKYHFLEYKAVFADWTFTNSHFKDVPLEPTDFVYADPPYDVEFTKYSKDGFTWDDQVATAEWLSKHSGPVILSNQATQADSRRVQTARFHPEDLRGAEKNQLHRRPQPGNRGAGDPESMSPGSTRTGVVLEAMILPALQQGGYSYEKQVAAGPAARHRQARGRCNCGERRPQDSHFAEVAAGVRHR